MVGGGHAHVQVLRRFMMKPVGGVRLTVVLDRPEAVYSGMVPGFVAGDYAARELEIDVVPLARRAGARVVFAAATRVDPVARRIEVEGRPAIAYDIASLDVGSTVRGLDLPGVREHALATRPICDLVARLPERLDAAGGEARVAVLGAGVAGVELAFTLEARLRAAGSSVRFTVLDGGPDLLPRCASRVRRAVRREAKRRGIDLRCGVRVVGVAKDAVQLENGESFPCELAVWASGAAPVPVIEGSPLPKDGAGFTRVRETLQVEGHDDLFAVGDCASLSAHPWVPKAGVYAVREGPVLDRNLRARLEGRAPERFRPQRDFLTLVNLGDRRALGFKWGAVVTGGWVWRWKDWIDRGFMRRFQVLDGDGAPAPDFPTPEAMGMEEMPCGGCAAKVGATALSRAMARLEPAPEDASVLVGLAEPDDAAAFRLPGGDVLLATIDAFRAFTDDPWLVGRVAAVNAASDVFATGGLPRHALALVTVPDDEPERAEETLYQVLSGIRAALDPLGISLVGGHTTTGEELFVGLSLTGGLAADAVLAKAGLRVGDTLVLSRALGSGVVLAADMQGLARGAWVRAAFAGMLRSNAEAATVARRVGARACTDVSGFGLAGHLGEMLRASAVSATVSAASLPALPGALALLERGVRSTFHEQNARVRRRIAASGSVAARPAFELLFDPQTSGGLLLGVPAGSADETVAALRAAGDEGAAAIGVVTEPRGEGAAFEAV